MPISLIIFVVLSFILVWVFIKSAKRTINNKKEKYKSVDERLPPWALRVLALFFCIIPVLSLITGRFWENPVTSIIVTVFFFSEIIDMLQLAKKKVIEESNRKK